MGSRTEVVVVVTAALLLGACSSSRSTGSSDPRPSRGSLLAVRMTGDGCTPRRLAAPSGLTELALTNDSRSATSFQVLSGDHVVGQVELLSAGRSSTISLDLPDGMYRTNCQVGTAATPGTLAVGGATGAVALGQSADLARAADAYRAFLVTQADGLIADLEALSGAVARGDLGAGRAAYVSARSHFGQIEPAADNFGDAEPVGQANLAQALDGPFAAGPSGPRLGLRLVELGLWDGAPVPSLGSDAAGALATAQELRTQIGAMHLDAVEAASGSGDELSQAIAEVWAAEGNRPPALDVTDLQAAADGARGLLDALHPALTQRDMSLDSTLAQRLARLDAAVATVRASAIDPAGGLASTARTPVVEAGDALADAMAQMAPILDAPAR